MGFKLRRKMVSGEMREAKLKDGRTVIIRKK